MKPEWKIDRKGIRRLQTVWTDKKISRQDRQFLNLKIWKNEIKKIVTF